MAHLIITGRVTYRGATKTVLYKTEQTPHFCVLVARESHLQRTGDDLGKGMKNVLSRKANTSCISPYLSFVHPKLLLGWHPWRFFGSLYSFGFFSSSEATAKEKAFLHQRPTKLLGQKMKRNNYWWGIVQKGVWVEVMSLFLAIIMLVKIEKYRTNIIKKNWRKWAKRQPLGYCK